MFAYRRLHESIVSKAIEYNVPVVFINPRGTSSTCPRCSTKLVYNHRLAVCPKCSFISDRDKVGAMNIWFKALKAYVGEPGSPLNSPAMKDETRQSRRTKNEGMKKIIKKYSSVIKSNVQTRTLFTNQQGVMNSSPMIYPRPTNVPLN